MRKTSGSLAGQVIFGKNLCDEPLIVPHDNGAPVTLSYVLLSILRDNKSYHIDVHRAISRILLGMMPKMWISEDDCISGIGFIPVQKWIK